MQTASYKSRLTSENFLKKVTPANTQPPQKTEIDIYGDYLVSEIKKFTPLELNKFKKLVNDFTFDINEKRLQEVEKQDEKPTKPVTRVVQQPVVQRTVLQPPVVQQQVLQQPIVQKPVLQQPVVGQPVVQQPVVIQPVVEQSVVQEPVRPTSRLFTHGQHGLFPVPPPPPPLLI